MSPGILSAIVKKELQAFILANEKVDERKLVLQRKIIQGVPSAIVADQISGRRKAKIKLPSFYQTTGIVYPPSIGLEQSSSEIASKFKARIIARKEPFQTNVLPIASLPRGVDLTGGFGVDSFFISQVCNQLDFVEPDTALLDIARHNHELLGANQIRYHGTTAEAFLANPNQEFDFVFIDPSRRSGSKKVFKLADCQPAISQLLPLIFGKTGMLLLKASPLLDLQQGLLELKLVEKVFVVAVDDECKEVLYLCTPRGVPEPTVICASLSSRFPEKLAGTDLFSFTFSQEKSTSSEISGPRTYLFEPNASILKAGAFKTLGKHHGLHKLHVNTHLYTSDQFIDNFPGRIFRIEILQPDANKLKAFFPDRKANVVVRNYPLSPEQLKKKWRLQDGGEKYLIGFCGPKGKFLAAASRLK